MPSFSRLTTLAMVATTDPVEMRFLETVGLYDSRENRRYAQTPEIYATGILPVKHDQRVTLNARILSHMRLMRFMARVSSKPPFRPM
jgi:hypothetical protein